MEIIKTHTYVLKGINELRQNIDNNRLCVWHTLVVRDCKWIIQSMQGWKIFYQMFQNLNFYSLGREKKQKPPIQGPVLDCEWMGVCGIFRTLGPNSVNMDPSLAHDDRISDQRAGRKWVRGTMWSVQFKDRIQLNDWRRRTYKPCSWHLISSDINWKNEGRSAELAGTFLQDWGERRPGHPGCHHRQWQDQDQVWSCVALNHIWDWIFTIYANFFSCSTTSTW